MRCTGLESAWSPGSLRSGGEVACDLRLSLTLETSSFVLGSEQTSCTSGYFVGFQNLKCFLSCHHPCLAQLYDSWLSFAILSLYCQLNTRDFPGCHLCCDTWRISSGLSSSAMRGSPGQWQRAVPTSLLVQVFLSESYLCISMVVAHSQLYGRLTRGLHTFYKA